MQKDLFTKRLVGQVGPGTIVSYATYCAKTEELLSLDLDTCDLTSDGIENIKRRMTAKGVNAKTSDNRGSALKAYARVIRGIRS